MFKFFPTKVSPIFGLYTLIITALGLFWQHRRTIEKRQEATYFSFYKTLQQLESVGRQQQEAIIRSFEKNEIEYPLPLNRALCGRAKFAQTFAADISEYIKSELNNAWIPQEDTAQTVGNFREIWSNPERKAEFYRKQKVFVDSLLLFSRQDSGATSALQKIFAPEHAANFAAIFSGRNSGQKRMALEAIRVENLAALSLCLAAMRKQSETLDGDFKVLLPGLTYETPCIRAGETFQAEVFALPYSEQFSNATFFVNNQVLPIEKGVGKFRTTFSSAGIQTLKVRCEIRNPITGQLQEIKKNFEIKICQ